MTIQELRDLHLAAVRAARAAELAAATFNSALARYLADRDAPPGLTVDLHATGKIMDPRQCAAPKVRDDAPIVCPTCKGEDGHRMGCAMESM